MTCLKLNIFIFTCILIVKPLQSQNFEWLRTYGNTSTVDATYGAAALENGESVQLIGNDQIYNKPFDSIHFDSLSFRLNKRSFLVKLDSNGHVIKAIALSFLAGQMCKDSSGDLYVAGGITDSVSFIGNKKLLLSEGNNLFAKFDKDLNLIWTSQDSGRMGVSNLIYSGGRVYFLMQAYGKIKLGDSTFNFHTTTRSPLYGELDKGNGGVIWANFLYNNNTTATTYTQLYLTGLVNLKGKLYISGYKDGYNTTVILKGDTFRKGGFVVMTDALGKYQKRFELYNKSFLWIRCMTTDGVNLFFGGLFVDTLKWGNKLILPEYTGGISSELFTASITPALQPRWFYHPKALDKSAQNTNIIDKVIYSGGFLYFGGRLTSRILVDSHAIIPRASSYSDVVLFKFDPLGNVLWATNAEMPAGYILALDAIDEKSVYAGGSFIGHIKFGPFKDTCIGNGNAWVTKITDYAIKRGPVISGPYCAGDTIKIPFSLTGNYDSANYFIAQLSDEEGNFISGYRELGRLKSNKADTIIGKLPMFKVASSDKYRIRVLSTKPAVQSYYIMDSLRLLIYSKDKAFAGNDTTICKGDTLNISTYGGTIWKWTPHYNIIDSTARIAKVHPQVTTTYRITISDSSGCGENDTAYKKVIVRANPVAKIVSMDTAVCIRATLPITAMFSKGDSLNYSWIWYSVDMQGSLTEIKSGNKKQQDSIHFKMPTNETDSQRITLRLSDGCSNIPGIANYTIKISKKKPRVLFNGKDTTLCENKASNIIALFSNGDVRKFNWRWYETNNAGFWFPGISSSNQSADTLFYTVPANAAKNKKLRVILKDNCSNLSDTANYGIRLKDTLQLTLNTNDTILCKGNGYTFKAKGRGGDTNAYQFEWRNKANGQLLSTADSFNLTADSAVQIQVSLKDNCMPGSAITSFVIQVTAALKGSMFTKDNLPAKDTTLCFGQTYQATAKGIGGDMNSYAFEWLLDNQIIGQKDSLSLNTAGYFSKKGEQQNLILVLKDNCTKKADSVKIQLNVLPQLNIKATSTDSICYKDKVIFKAEASGGNGNYTYQWKDKNNTVAGTMDSLLVAYTSAGQRGWNAYILILSDGCTVPADSIMFNTYFRPILKVQLSATDTCPEKAPVILNLDIQGGKGDYGIQWYKNNIGIAGNSPTLIATPLITPSLFTAIVKDGCSAQPDTSQIILALKPGIQLGIKGSCLGDTTIAHAISSQLPGNTKYNWLINLQNTTSSDSVIKTVLPATGIYQIIVRTAGLKCNGSDTANITITAKPKADFTYQRLKTNTSGVPYQFTDQSLNADKWYWQFGNKGNSIQKDPLFVFRDTGNMKIFLCVSNKQSCMDSIEKTIHVQEYISFFFPNALSPDGNGINDDFGLNPNQYDLVKSYRFEIYNRWGERVFETNDVTKHWQVDNKTMQGVYLFKAVIKDIFDVTSEISGAVEVLR